jgi:beta-galactosidase/beta-glucuronidase
LAIQPRPEYPRPRLRRKHWLNLNGAWRFSFDRPTFDRSIIVPFAYQAELSGIGARDFHDSVWYSRTFEPPKAERLILHFGAVDYRATVWVNDVQVADHEGGHTPFEVDISADVREGENQLVVRADDPAADRTIPRGKQYWKEEPETIFYTGTSGIWQTVWLEPLPHRHFTSLQLTPDLEAGALDFEVQASSPGLGVVLEVRLDGHLMGSFSGAAGPGRVALRTVRSWSPESPVLYDVSLALMDETGRELDHVESYFGLRSVAARDGLFFLNGEPYIQRLVLDQGYFPGGWYTAATDEDLRANIELARAFGFNGARKHQKIEDPRWLYWADRLGLLVWEEMPSFHDYTAEAERRLTTELGAAITRDLDHPCIVAWVPANESFGLDALSASERAQVLVRLYHVVKRLDNSRPVSSNDGWEHALTDLCTLHDYGPPADLHANYSSTPAALDQGKRPRPSYLPGFSHRGEPILLSEFGGVALQGSGGWGFSETSGPTQLAERYGALVAALMAPGPIEGFCYTQLNDIEQERNGLLTFDRRPKVDPKILSPLTQKPKRR